MTERHPSAKPCGVEGCARPHRCNGYCAMHNARFKKTGVPLGTTRKVGRAACTVGGCDKPVNGRGYCHAHYSKWQKYGDPLGVAGTRPTKICSIDVCGKKHVGLGYCAMHLRRFKLYGDPLTVQKAPAGTGHVYRGYRVVKRGGRHMAEHLFVMEEILGRPVDTKNGETVHHKNGQRADNRPENLELWSSKQPRGQRVSDKLAWAREVIALYAPIEDKVALMTSTSPLSDDELHVLLEENTSDV